MCVSGHMEFQNRVGRFYFYFVRFFLYGDDRETIYPNGETPGNPLKILEKVSGWGSGVKTRHGRVTCNIQLFMPKYICRACRCISSIFLLMPAV